MLVAVPLIAYPRQLLARMASSPVPVELDPRQLSALNELTSKPLPPLLPLQAVAVCTCIPSLLSLLPPQLMATMARNPVPPELCPKEPVATVAFRPSPL